MNLDEYLATLTADGARIASFGDVALDAEIPTCPNWRIADLVVHVGWVHHMLAQLARVPNGGRATRNDSPELRGIIAKMMSAERPDEDLLGWFRHGVADLCRELSEADPNKTITTYLGTHQPLLLARRAATETAVHRRDAESAVGQPEGPAPALAAEAIDEFLDKIVPVFFKHADFAGTGQRICLEGVDRCDTWLITVTSVTSTCSSGAASPRNRST